MTQALTFTADFKLGDYMKIPPRTMFWCQVRLCDVALFTDVLNSCRSYVLLSLELLSFSCKRGCLLIFRELNTLICDTQTHSSLVGKCVPLRRRTGKSRMSVILFNTYVNPWQVHMSKYTGIRDSLYYMGYVA